MKQKFFTFLAMLMFVSVNALAVEVSISAKYGATTFVCDQNLNFAEFCSDPTAIVMKPYYISGYDKETGAFTLTAFTNATVPANTPMILLGTAHTTASASELISVDVPVASMSSDAAEEKRNNVFSSAGGYCWLVPAIASSCSIDEFIPRQSGTGNLPAMNATFYDNTSASFPLYVKQTNSGILFGYSSRDEYEIIETYEYYDSQELGYQGNIKDGTDTELLGYLLDVDGDLYEGDFSYEEPENLGYKIVLHASYHNKRGKPKEVYVLYQWAYDEEEGENYWLRINTVTSADANYNSSVGKWYDPTTKSQSVNVTTYWDVPETRDFTNYVLSVNSEGKPVFKKCNSSSNGGAGTTVAAGKCYVRVWNDVLVGAAAAREDIGWTFEEEEDLNSFEENTTGIKDVKNIKNKKEIFNMKGQKLEKMQKGLNIVNGKKVYVK